MYRLFHNRYHIDGIHGPVTFVPIEIDRFKENIYDNVVEEQRLKLARIFRHPNSLDCLKNSAYHDLVSPSKIKNSLDILVQHHSTYATMITTQTSSNSSLNEEEIHALSSSSDVSNALRQSDTLNELTDIFKRLWGTNDKADEEDVLLVDTRDQQHTYAPRFLIDWQARVPMSKIYIYM